MTMRALETNVLETISGGCMVSISPTPRPPIGSGSSRVVVVVVYLIAVRDFVFELPDEGPEEQPAFLSMDVMMLFDDEGSVTLRARDTKQRLRCPGGHRCN